MAGELGAAAGPGPRLGTYGTLRGILAREGPAGLQAGLPIAVIREGSKNLFRLGMFEPLLYALHDRQNGPPPLYKRMLAGMASGALGAYTCNPLDLLKSRMQNQVGRAGDYKGPVDGLTRLLREEGLAGAWRGCHIGALRSSVNTAANLTTYTALKDYLKLHHGARETVDLHVGCSFASAASGVLIGNPLDVLRTRLYNQPTGPGALYAGAGDAFAKILRQEGPGAFYKGATAHFMRVGPHFVLTFVVLEQLRAFLRDQNELQGLEVAALRAR